jgi:hypothetical protein
VASHVKTIAHVVAGVVGAVLLLAPGTAGAQSTRPATSSHQGAKASKGNEIVLPDDRLVVGVVEEVKDNEIKVNTGEMMPRYLPLKEARQEGIRPLIKGDEVEIWVNDQDVVVDYHPLDTLGWNQIIRGTLVQPLIVGQEWAIIRKDKGKEAAYAIRPLARSKVAAIPVDEPALFLLDRAKKIVDATFGSREALARAAEQWEGSPPMGVNREVAGIILEQGVTIRTADGTRRTFEVRPFVGEKLRQVPNGKGVTLLIDNENKVVDVAIPSR